MNECEYAVLDSRAQYDPDIAAILECCGPNKPSWSSLQRDWGDQEAVLIRWHGYDGKMYTKTEVIGVIR